MATKIIAVCNFKGGVGKTTTTINLAHGLALRGKAVLAVDLDPQAHLGTALGLRPEPGAFYALTMGLQANETAFVKQYVRQTGRERLWVLPGDQTTNAAQVVLQAQNAPVNAVRECLGRFMRSGLDYVILDTAPSVGGILERAIWAADLVLAPTNAEFLGTDSIRQLMETLKMLQAEKGWKGALWGVLPTMVDDRIREHRAAIEDLRKVLGERVLPAIHRAAVVAECPGLAKTIFEFQPESRAADEYMALAKAALRF